MKKYKIYSILSAALFLIVMACSDEFVGNSPNMNDNVGAVTKVTVNPAKNFFNLNSPPLSSAEIEFTVDVDGFGITTVNSVEVELVYSDKDRLYDPFREEYFDSVYAPVILQSITSFPSTVVITGQSVADALGRPVDSLKLGDFFQVTLPINTADGRRLTTALGSDLCNEPAQPSFGGCGVGWAIACPSSLDTSVSYQITSATAPVSAMSGTLTWATEAPGVYSWDTFTFGAYDAQFGCCEQVRGGTSLTAIDVCNSLSMSAADGFGCVWDLNVDSVVGSVLTVTVTGDCLGGSYTIEMTRTDGSAWPPLTN